MRLIDADVFKEYVGDSVLDADLSIPYNETTVREYLDDMPTINAKPVVYAHWELEFDSKCREIGYHCSNCDGDWHRKAVRSITNFCPNCGAEMERRDDREARWTPQPEW